MAGTDSNVVIITGASQGIGEGLVRGYLQRGYRVVANSRSIRPDAYEGGVIAIAGDIADPAVARRVVEVAVAEFGRVDTLVNNAGVFLSKPFVEYTEEDYNRVLSVNLAGFFHVTQRAASVMLAQGRGHVVNITTSLVDQPLSAIPAVLASLTKGGLAAATRSLAIEFAGRGVRVNAVSPGVIKSPMNAGADRERLAGLHPMRRMGEIQEVVDAVLYLESAAFVTGEILHVDGGQHAGY